ncbi:hypothetical protein CEXT_577151 [Caerostris extrusa]|uniref:Uncharacterized protein n=1 Tax=Caerostris extrusa TaxID=172846 RepID=A0AAV4N722_CAEEX|nr:hypothetical protein CEXT_577151 [Caerostris extrusa]
MGLFKKKRKCDKVTIAFLEESEILSDKTNRINLLFLINKTGISFLHPKSTKINTTRKKTPFIAAPETPESRKRASVDGPILLPENKDLQGRPGLRLFHG